MSDTFPTIKLTSYIRPLTSYIVNMIDINKIQSALQLLKEERAHVDEYIQIAAEKKKKLDKELNASLNRYNCQSQIPNKKG